MYPCVRGYGQIQTHIQQKDICWFRCHSKHRKQVDIQRRKSIGVSPYYCMGASLHQHINRCRTYTLHKYYNLIIVLPEMQNRCPPMYTCHIGVICTIYCIGYPLPLLLYCMLIQRYIGLYYMYIMYEVH